jgi:hypothetical protein
MSIIFTECARFEVLTEVSMKIQFCCDMMV